MDSFEERNGPCRLRCWNLRALAAISGAVLTVAAVITYSGAGYPNEAHAQTAPGPFLSDISVPSSPTKTLRRASVSARDAAAPSGAFGTFAKASSTAKRQQTIHHAGEPLPSTASAVELSSSSSSPGAPTSRRLQVNTTYYPGQLTVLENGLRLSQGLRSIVLSSAGSLVTYPNGRKSKVTAHKYPDYGACFVDTRSTNVGGWIYVSNSEDRTAGKGGVGAYTFNARGKLTGYRRLLQNTTANCGGGLTPWGAYISCEEQSRGFCYQVDPEGTRPAQIITMGKETNGAVFESFAYNDKNQAAPEFYTTEDSSIGVVRRFRPNNPDWTQPWTILTGNGVTDYLMVDPVNKTFSWTTNRTAARENARLNFPNTEGIDFAEGSLFVITKIFKSMFILDVNSGTYNNVTTKNGAFDGQPDQVIRILGPTPPDFQDEKWLFFTEDGGTNAGIFARNGNGDFVTILESTTAPGDETVGLAFSPDGTHLYFALQDQGKVYDITRRDGQPFQAKALNVKYHSR